MATAIKIKGKTYHYVKTSFDRSIVEALAKRIKSEGNMYRITEGKHRGRPYWTIYERAFHW